MICKWCRGCGLTAHTFTEVTGLVTPNDNKGWQYLFVGTTIEAKRKERPKAQLS